MFKTKYLLILALVVCLSVSLIVPGFAAEDDYIDVGIDYDLPLFAVPDSVDPPYSLSSEPSILNGDFYYTLTSDRSSYVVTGYNSAGMGGIVDAYVDGLPVIAVHEGALAGCDVYYSVSFLGPIEYIHPSAFSGANVSLFIFYVDPGDSVLCFAPWGGSIQKPEYWVAGYCYRPYGGATMKYILYSHVEEYDMVSDCPYPIDFSVLHPVLRFGEMPVYEINEYSFSGFEALEYVVIPPSIGLIEKFAFSSCPNLHTVIFEGKPSNVQTGIFSECSSLSKVLCSWKEGSISTAFWGAPATTEFVYNYKGVMPFMRTILSVFTGVGQFLVGSLSGLTILFYNEGLTFLGVLAVAALVFSIVLLIFMLIRRFIHFRG